ncbi:G0/G1 switch protein 2 [Mastacembelus armatus]|uniref:G0/G1 switch 2 n=1 Tax=Mastacembelus armatus TaxID=205130 RepID=A0A3Q3LE07_9TELE|nr:G0/G1 switch protein 2-like [Mastacembelus armatus]XP_026188598.1 G0/G1 switch protein 2-like [Mastacembelus armatus]
MATMGELVPFVKEMLSQRPSRSLLKIYMLGSTLAVLGAVGGLVEMIFLPFVEQEATEDEPTVLIVEREKVMKSNATSVRPEAVDLLGTVELEAEAKAKYLGSARRRSSTNRLHAS